MPAAMYSLAPKRWYMCSFVVCIKRTEGRTTGPKRARLQHEAASCDWLFHRGKLIRFATAISPLSTFVWGRKCIATLCQPLGAYAPATWSYIIHRLYIFSQQTACFINREHERMRVDFPMSFSNACNVLATANENDTCFHVMYIHLLTWCSPSIYIVRRCWVCCWTAPELRHLALDTNPSRLHKTNYQRDHSMHTKGGAVFFIQPVRFDLIPHSDSR